MGIGYNGRVNDPQAAPAEGPAAPAGRPPGPARTGDASAQAGAAPARAGGPAARTDGGPARAPGAPRPARRRNTAPPREDVLAAAMATIAERGLDGLTMAGLGRDVGMSSGHLLYYFRTKDELLLRTLEWSEGRLGAERGALLSRHDLPVAGRLAAYVELYVPDGPRDPHWTLWLEVWNRSQYAGDDARERQAAIEGAWHRDLVALIAEGVSRGELRPVDPDRYATRLRALLDGFSVHVAVGLPGTGRAQVLAQVREHLAETLLSGS